MLNKHQEINLARHIFTPDDFRAFVDHVDGRETALEAHPDSRLARLASLMVHLGAVADTCPPPDPSRSPRLRAATIPTCSASCCASGSPRARAAFTL